MKNRLTVFFMQICHAALLAGVIMLVIGLYHLVIKAGIPYQDPPWKWRSNGWWIGVSERSWQ